MGAWRLLLLSLALGCSADAASSADDAGDASSSGPSSSDSTGTTPPATTGSATGTDATSAAVPTSGGSEETTAGRDDDGATTGAPSGCGLEGIRTGVIDRYLEVAGQWRHFVLSIPEDYDPNVPYPVILLLHGADGNGHQFRFYAGVEAAADGPAIFVYPDGLLFNDTGKTGWDLTMDGVDLPFMDAIHEHVESSYCIDPDRVFVGGHSFGGWLTNLLGCVRGDRFRAVAPVAGGGPVEGCGGQVAAWIAHGIDDPVVPTEYGEVSLEYWRTANHCSMRSMVTDPEPCVAFVDCDEGFDTVWCLHDEWFPIIGTHTWPAFAGPGVWQFFASF